MKNLRGTDIIISNVGRHAIEFYKENGWDEYKENWGEDEADYTSLLFNIQNEDSPIITTADFQRYMDNEDNEITNLEEFIKNCKDWWYRFDFID